MQIANRNALFWWGKRPDIDTPAMAFRRGRWVGGDVTVNRNDGSENYASGDRFQTAADFVDLLQGEGAPVLQGQPGVIGHQAYVMLGQETVTHLGGGVYEHVATPAPAAFFIDAWKTVGDAALALRQRFNKGRPSSLRMEASSGSKVLKSTMSGLFLDPGETYDTDPVAGEEVGEPFLYTEAEGTFKIATVGEIAEIYRAHSSFAIQINDNVSAWQGDAPRPADFILGLGSIDLENITVLVNQQGLGVYNRVFYGHPSPPPGSRPVTTITGLGSYEFNLTRGRCEIVTITGAPTGGFFRLTYDGQQTADIAHDATAATVKARLVALSNIEAGDVEVTGGPGPATPYTIVFARSSAALLTVTNTFTGGSTPNAAVTDVGVHRQVKTEIFGVRWRPELSIPGNPDGGAVELQLAGQARKVGTQPMIRVTTRSADPAYS